MIQDSIQLPDGRALDYNIFGPSDGRPVLYFHGTPSSRLEPLLPSVYGIDMIALLQKHHLQLLSIDRPGMGFSTLHPEGTFLSFADDAAELLRHKNIRQCPVLCWSGGGPYALAIAHKYPELIPAVFMIAGFTIPLSTPGLFEEMKRNKYYFASASNTPLILEGILNYLAKKEITRSFPQWIAGTPEVDYEYLKDPKHLMQVASITLQEACRYGSTGAVKEAAGYFNDYGFSLTGITQPVFYWWGSEDVEIINQHPHAIEQQIPHHAIYYKEGEGHVSIYIRYIEDVLEKIADSLS
ncbi:alpha/beta hydrolase [Chitinophagaceae bacterium LB-8]|uniref:Alpha/beta hydrolase n=1 Tax=Paraflavisolibacter caeni TaxID=2982496 RepID=A0A9X2XXT4_9BACT|nr:alpha/beta hydrolase [Paraflavisolibacter caeni]MCU7550532.1 alpha/beta hydrolase [Paraflavisolibacter caeni]